MCSLNLPEHPKVVVDGTAIVINYEDGRKEIWGHEANKKIAKEVAMDIELGLKAIDYVSLEVMKLLSEIAEQLESLDIPAEYVKDYVCEGYTKVSKRFRELEIRQLVTTDN